MARATIRWTGLLVSLVAALVILLSIFSPSTIYSAQDVAHQLQDKFNDNASPGSINEKLGDYGPRAYRQVQSWWSRVFQGVAEPRGLQPEEGDAEDIPRCKVYTYYDKRTKSEDTEALLQVWLKAWWALGLFPVILTNEMSSKHPDYQQLHKQYGDSGLDIEKLDAILAMDHMGAEGMLTSAYVFPMTTLDDKMLRQMRKCQVLDVLSKYKHAKDDILRGSSLAYKIVVKALIKNSEPLDPELVPSGLEAVPGVWFRIHEEIQTFAVYSQTTVQALYPTLFDKNPVTSSEGKKFYFVKGQLASLVNSHLQDNFLNNHRSGVTVLSPLLGGIVGDVLSKPSLRIAKELLHCNLSPLPGPTCPPNRALTITKCFSCSQLVSSAFIKPIQQFQPQNSTYFIGNVPHPLSTLLLSQRTEDLSPKAIRDSPRDSWIKSSLSASLHSKSGPIQGLIFLSESLWKNEDNLLPDAHLWRIFEEDQFSDIEYDVGFTLPGLRSGVDESSSDALGRSPPSYLNPSKLRSMITDPQDERAKAGLSMIEVWSQYDTGSHQLIQNYQEYKAGRLRVMMDVNKEAFSEIELM